MWFKADVGPLAGGRKKGWLQGWMEGWLWGPNRVRAGLLAAALVAVAAGLAGRATLALFTDSEGAQQDVQAGTLSLISWRDMSDTVPGPLFYTTAAEGQTPTGQPGQHPTGPWAPGDSHTRVLHLRNTGSLDGWLTAVSAQQTGGSADLAGALLVSITAPDPFNPAVQEVVAQAPLSAFLSGQVPLAHASGEPVAAWVGNLAELRFTVSLPLSAGNHLQGADLELAFTVHAEQMAHNP